MRQVTLALYCGLILTGCAAKPPPPPVVIIETKIERPPIDARLFDHGAAPLPECISTDDCVARYIGALKGWGEELAGKIDAIKAGWK